MEKTNKKNKACIALSILVVLLSGALFGILFVLNGGINFEPFINAAMYSLKIITLGFLGTPITSNEFIVRFVDLFLTGSVVVFAMIFIVAFLSLIATKKSHKWSALISFTLAYVVFVYQASYAMVNMQGQLMSNMDQITSILFVFYAAIQLLLAIIIAYSFFFIATYKEVEKVVEVRTEVETKVIHEQVEVPAQVVEETEEAEEPVEENEDDDEDEVEEVIDENGNKKLIIKKVAFATKLKKADAETKARYNEIKGYLLAYGEKDRLAFGKETFSSHRNISAVVTISGKTIKVYLPLDASDFENSNVKLIDVSKKKKYEKTPSAFRLTSKLSIKKCKALIDIVMSTRDTMLGDVVEKDYAKETIKKFNQMQKEQKQ